MLQHVDMHIGVNCKTALRVVEFPQMNLSQIQITTNTCDHDAWKDEAQETKGWDRHQVHRRAPSTAYHSHLCIQSTLTEGGYWVRGVWIYMESMLTPSVTVGTNSSFSSPYGDY